MAMIREVKDYDFGNPWDMDWENDKPAKKPFDISEISGVAGNNVLVYPKTEDKNPPWMWSFDARDWAKAFVTLVEKNPSIAPDEMTMVGWFANALMRGYDEGKKRALES